MEIIFALLLLGLILGGVALFGFTLSLLYCFVTGLIVGALARLVLPGKENIGLLGTAMVGVGGSFIGGMIGRALHTGQLIQLALSVVAAAILLTVFGFRARSRS